MHRKGVAWLYAELPRLVERGVLTAEIADALRRHYGPLDPGGSRSRWGEILLAVFGALLVGGGIILILAHNWDALGRPARAAIALGTLAAAQALTVFGALRRPASVAWTEAASGFLVAVVGAAIALVGQTYHAGGSFESLMRAWLWLVVLIPYLTGSALASIGFWALLVVRGANLPWTATAADVWPLALAGAPFVVLRVRREPDSWASTLLAIAAAASIFVVGSIVTIDAGWRGLWAVFQVSFLAALVAIARWPNAGEATGSWRGRLFGTAWLPLAVIGTILTFYGVWDGAEIATRQLRNPNVAGAVLVAVACAALASIATIRLARAGSLATAAATAAAVLVVLMDAFALRGIEEPGWIAFNVWLLAVGVLTLVEGVRRLELDTMNRGLFALSALLVCRFFDTDLGFLVRGLGFVALGIACFALNIWQIRRVRRSTA